MKKINIKRKSIKWDSPLGRIAGIVKLPDNFDYKKELREILWEKYLSIETRNS